MYSLYQAYAGHVITRLVHVHDRTGEGRRQAGTLYVAVETATDGGVA